jgi:hypothetical protein
MLEAEQVHRRRAKLNRELSGLDCDRERCYSVLVSMMLLEQIILGVGRHGRRAHKCEAQHRCPVPQTSFAHETLS